MPRIDNNLQRWPTSESFFKWSSDTHSKEIKQLLSGESALFYADITKSRVDALKFNAAYITVEIKSDNGSNKTLNSLLEHFYIELTHSGVSKYKFKDKYYSISSNYNWNEKLLIRYQYGGSVCANEACRKLAENKPLISPFTLWQMKIEPIKPKK